MPEDPHLFPGEGERRRRYARLLIDPTSRCLEVFDHDSFFQAKKFDDLYGDIHRQFAPMTSSEYQNDFFQNLLVESFFALPFQKELIREPIEISAHMIRIEATPGSECGRPAPEGIHRDGYHFGSIHLMTRENVKGAENHIYDLRKQLRDTLILETPMDSIYFDDAAIFHGVSTFGRENELLKATRDMLILLYQPLSESPQMRGGARKKLRSF
ncbi:MAG: 2OG-Fe dioxygenase family protein [Bdellovibrionales bacterium]